MGESRKSRSHITKTGLNIPAMPWANSWEDTVKSLEVEVSQGLQAGEPRKRRRVFGRNMLREVKPKSALTILINQFRNLIVLFLFVATLLSFMFGDHVEGIAIGIVIVINAAIGFVTELRGVRSIEALRKLGSVSSRVRRNGTVSEIPAKDLVPGDIVILEGGDIVTADLRLVTSSKLQADESVLTGESFPVEKSPDAVPEKTSLAERANMLFKGIALTRGSGEAVVVATGMQTELGKISSLVEQTLEEETPLEQRLAQLANWLIWVSLGTAVVVVISGIIAGRDMVLMIETGIALAVASIPEGLPIVATIALARGMWRMARRNALIKKLAAVETLGATSVICTDKTGTLTENRLTVAELVLDSGKIYIDEKADDVKNIFLTESGIPLLPHENLPLFHAIEVSVLCNNASLADSRQGDQDKAVGDPLEIAFLTMAAKAGFSQADTVGKYPEEKEVAFDSEIKMMATYHPTDAGFRVAVKGAPESVLESCEFVLAAEGDQQLTEDNRKEWMVYNESMASRGLRVLALAEKDTQDINAEPYKNLKLIGLVGLMDPPREDVRDAIKLCRDAGIRVIMATGDQVVTARAIGKAVGIVQEDDAPVVHGLDFKKVEELSTDEKNYITSVNLFARVNPSQKLDLIALHREKNAIVAMTGDGVNDAPALKNADIGIAMGKRGTQVAREASDMILKDDAFSSIVHAVEQGRVIFKNIRAFVIYLLSCNISEIMTVTFAAFVALPLPLLPLQILFLNIVTDVFPALALAAGEGYPGIMKQPPRDKYAPILTKAHWIHIVSYGALITSAVLGAMVISLYVLGLPERESVTISFLTLAFAQLWHVFNMRERSSGIFNNAIIRNPFIWGALALCTVLLLLTLYVPILSSVLKVAHPGFKGMALIFGMSLVPLVAGQLFTTLFRSRQN